MPATFQVLNSCMCMVAAMSELSFRLWWFSKHNMFFHHGRPIIETVGTHLIDYGPGFPFSVMLCGVNCNSLLFPETNQDDWPTPHIFDRVLSLSLSLTEGLLKMQMSVVDFGFLAVTVRSIKGAFNPTCMNCTNSLQAPGFVFINICDTARHQEQARPSLKWAW